MMGQVNSELILRGDLAQLLRSSFQVNEHIASQLPLESVEVYRAGFRAALSAVATAYNLNLPELREAEAVSARRQQIPTRFDMRL